MQWFDDGIRDMLEHFAYDFYVVQPDTSVTCVCTDFATKQGDPECKKCLGQGYKIYIRKIRGALEDRSSTFQNINVRETSSSHIYYIDRNYPVDEKDVIVDGEDVVVIHRVDRKRSTGKDTVYFKCYGVPKKNQRTLFLKNFQQILKDWEDKHVRGSR